MTKKRYFINKLDNLSAHEKEKIIAFFSVNPVFESRIDWNNKYLKFEDFEEVFSLSAMSRKNRKNTVNMFLNYNCKIIVSSKEFVILVPLDWDCARFITSFNCGGEGAEWCIGSRLSNRHWNELTEKGSIFYFMYFFERHPVFGKKLIIQINNKNTAWFYTQKNRYNSFCLLAEYLHGALYAGK